MNVNILEGYHHEWFVQLMVEYTSTSTLTSSVRILKRHDVVVLGTWSTISVIMFVIFSIPDTM